MEATPATCKLRVRVETGMSGPFMLRNQVSETPLVSPSVSSCCILIGWPAYCLAAWTVPAEFHEHGDLPKCVSSMPSLTITAQSGRGQVQTVHTVLGAARGRGGVELAVGVDRGVDRLLAGSHGVREDGVHITVVGTVLEGRPVNTGLTCVVTGHHRVFVVRNDQGLYLFKRTINTQLLAMGFGTGVVHEIRILLGGSHPGVSCRGLFGERMVTRTTVHAVDRRHRVSQMLLLVRESGTATGQPVAIHGPIAELRTHNAIGRWDGITDFILNRLSGVSRRRRRRGCLLL